MIHGVALSKTYRVAPRASGLGAALRSFVRPEFTTVRAPDNVSFSIAPGEIVGYIGPNGAGKSSTIKVLSGILVPDSGVCRVGGRVPWKDRKAHVVGLGVVFGQRSQLWWDVPVEDSFELLRDIYRIRAGDYRLRKKQLSERLDEPTIGLDAPFKRAVRSFIAELNRSEETTVLLTTHDTGDLARPSARPAPPPWTLLTSPWRIRPWKSWWFACTRSSWFERPPLSLSDAGAVRLAGLRIAAALLRSLGLGAPAVAGRVRTVRRFPDHGDGRPGGGYAGRVLFGGGCSLAVFAERAATGASVVAVPTDRRSSVSHLVGIAAQGIWLVVLVVEGVGSSHA